MLTEKINEFVGGIMLFPSGGKPPSSSSTVNAVLDRRMSGEEAEEIGKGRRIFDEHLLHFRWHMRNHRIRSEIFFSAENQRRGNLSVSSTDPAFGQIFALARNGETQNERQQIADKHDDPGDSHKKERAAAATIAAIDGDPHAAPHDLCDERNHADEHNRDDQQPAVAIDDVASARAPEPLPFLRRSAVRKMPLVTVIEKLFFIDAAGTGVHLVGIDDVVAGRFEAARDA